MTLDQVANALNVKENTIMTHLKTNAEELIEGVHWGPLGYTDRQGKTRVKRVLYKRGIIRISMFVRAS